MEQAVDHRQAFELAHLRIIAFDDQARLEFGDQQFDPHRLQRVHSPRQRLQHETIAVTVNDQTGQQIAFGVNQAVSVRVADYALAPFGGGAQTRQPELAVNLDIVFGNQPQRDFGLFAVMRARDESSAMVNHAHDCAAFGFGFLRHVAAVNPRMA